MTKICMKRQLADCLKKLMTNTTIDKITIQDITGKLGVNRQTFYYHFKDIYDLLHWTLQQEAVTLLKDKESEQLWNDGLLALFQYLEDNKAFVLSTVQSLGVDQFKQFFYGEIYEIINSVTHKIGEEVKADVQYTEFLTHFYTLALPTIAISWVQGEIEVSVEEMITMIDDTIKNQIFGAKYRLQQESLQT